MSLFIEFHLIQNFAPSNLNRDDTGAPKDAIFGGHRRARISSQCLKRSIRSNTKVMNLIPVEFQSVRTKKLVQLLEDKLVQLGRIDSKEKIKCALSGAKLALKDKWETETLLFLGEGEIERLAQLIHKYWDDLKIIENNEAEQDKKETEKDKKEVEKNKRKAKTVAKTNVPKEVIDEIKKTLNGQKAVDVALYGRMLADMPDANQYASCQVAHAISTHKVEREFDYFTAIDERGDSSESGARMIGQVEFNSATFYRYATIELNKLVSNLQNDTDLALISLQSFIKSIIMAIPTGKQNSFAAHNPPSFVGIALRHTSPLNLANAFEKPIKQSLEMELTSLSIKALEKHDEIISSVYGHEKDSWTIIDLTDTWPKEKGKICKNVEELSKNVVDQVREKLEI